MAITILQHVKPGDIISSDLVNYLIDNIIDLDQRLSTLQSVTPSGPITITGFNPSVQVPIGQVLVINGTGFAFPPEQNVVRIDDVQVTSFRPGSTSIRLEFIVPAVPNVPQGGRNVIVSVANASGGPVTRLYRLTPAVPVIGNPPTITTVTRTDNTNAPLTPGGNAFVNGTNFSTTASENEVRMSFVALVNNVPTTINLPRQNDPAIAVTQASATQLTVTVPLMPELPLNQSVTLNVQVRVGAHPPATANTLVRRT
jgi:hypothetical protein